MIANYRKVWRKTTSKDVFCYFLWHEGQIICQTSDLQETPKCSIPKEGGTASPSPRSLCGVSASAGRWFQLLQGKWVTAATATAQQSPRFTAEALTVSVCVGLSRRPFGGLPDSGWIKPCSETLHRKLCSWLKRDVYLVFPAGSTYVVFSSCNHFPAAMTCTTES